jgi:hypothetical protein
VARLVLSGAGVKSGATTSLSLRSPQLSSEQIPIMFVPIDHHSPRHASSKQAKRNDAQPMRWWPVLASCAVAAILAWGTLLVRPFVGSSAAPQRRRDPVVANVAEPFRVEPPAVPRIAPKPPRVSAPIAQRVQPSPVHVASSLAADYGDGVHTQWMPEELRGSPAPQVPDAHAPSDADLQTRWSAESPDPKWSAEIDDYLRQTSTAAGLDPSVVQTAQCGATLCRISLHFADIGAAAAFEQAAQNPNLSYQSAPQAVEDGWNVVVFLSRPGQEA